MSHNAIMYDVEAHIAEIYDQVETETDDVALIRRLNGNDLVRCAAPLARFRRSTTVTLAAGNVIEREYEQHKHPVSQAEVQTWLERHGFVVEQMYGDRAANPYLGNSKRAIFWAKRQA